MTSNPAAGPRHGTSRDGGLSSRPLCNLANALGMAIGSAWTLLSLTAVAARVETPQSPPPWNLVPGAHPCGH